MITDKLNQEISSRCSSYKILDKVNVCVDFEDLTDDEKLIIRKNIDRILNGKIIKIG